MTWELLDQVLSTRNRFSSTTWTMGLSPHRHGAVEGWWDSIGVRHFGGVAGERAKKEIAAGSGAGFGFREVGCVAVDVAD
jgi:hypothetical protein